MSERLPATPRDVRRQLLIAAAALGGVYLVVFVPGIVTAVRTLTGAAPPMAPAGWQAQVAAVEWDVFTVAVVLLVVVRWLPNQAPLVTRQLGTGRVPRPAAVGAIGAAAVYVAVASASGWLGSHAVALAHLSSSPNTQLGYGPGGLLVAAAASLAAGVTEEITLVALPVAVVMTAAGQGRRAVQVAPGPLVLGVMVVLRLLPHLYYGWGSVFVVFWTVGAYALFRWIGSIWPLVAGHVVYDWIAVTQHAFPQMSRILVPTLWVIAVFGIGIVAASLLVRAAGQPLKGFALTRVTLTVLPLGVSYSTVSPSLAPVSARPRGEAEE